MVTTSNAADVSAIGFSTRLGVRKFSGGALSPHNGKMALWKASATAPSADQIAQIYRDELALFQPGAQCTLAGNNPAVTALTYDETTELLHAGTGTTRSAFKGLQRVESEDTSATTGTIVALSASFGAVLIGGGTASRYSQPAVGVRDELRNRYDARRALARELVDFDYDSVSAQTAFPLPIGFEPKMVYLAGSKKRNGATKDYTVSFDGYRHTVNFGVTPGAAWVSITAYRSN